MAGILFKNAIKNLQREETVENCWSRVEETVKTEIRQHCLMTLADNIPLIRRTAAQCVAIIGKEDIPQGNWLDCVDILIQNSTHEVFAYKEASIMTVGYMCEELRGVDLPKEITDKFLKAILGRMMQEETDNNIKKIAILALENAIVIAAKSFDIS